MPPNLLVSVFLFATAIALMFSPMPFWIKLLIAASFGLAGFIYLADELGWISSIADKQFLVRYAWLVLSSVIMICVAAWRIGVYKWKAL